MVHLFAESGQFFQDRIVIEGQDLTHLKSVLRLQPGEALLITQRESGQNYACRLLEYTAEGAVLTVEEVLQEDRELPCRILLFQGLPKADKMELILQKGTELGAAEFIPVENLRCVVKLSGERSDKKIKRWQAIVQSASEQSKRQLIPEVREPMRYKEALAYAAKEADHILLAYEAAGDEAASAAAKGPDPIAEIKPGETVAVFIGPEGGYDAEEARMAVEAGAKILSLGKRILRTETAGLAALSFITYHLEIRHV